MRIGNWLKPFVEILKAITINLKLVNQLFFFTIID